MTNWIATNYIEIFGAVAGIIYVFLEIRQNIWLWPVGIITSAVYIWVFFTGKLYADMSLQGYYLVISVIGGYWWGRRQIHPPVEGKTGAGSPVSPLEGKAGNGSPVSPLEGKTGNGSPVSPLEGGGGGVRQIHPPDPLQRGNSHNVASLQRGNSHNVASFQEGNSQGETEERRDEGTQKLAVSRIRLKTGIILFIVFVILYSGMWFVLDRFTDSPVPEWDSFITSLSIIATWMLARKIYEHWYLWIIINIAAALLFYTRALYPTVILYLVYMIMSFAGLKEWKKSLTQLPARGSDQIPES